VNACVTKDETPITVDIALKPTGQPEDRALLFVFNARFSFIASVIHTYILFGAIITDIIKMRAIMTYIIINARNHNYRMKSRGPTWLTY